MRHRLFSLGLLASAFAGAWLATAVQAHADTYMIVSLENDNHQFYGMDDRSNVVFTYDACPPDLCYYTFSNGSFAGTAGTPPALAYDYSKVPCYSYTTPACSVTYDGRTATAYDLPGTPIDDLFLYSGGNPPQLITTVDGIAGFLAINGSGDIVFDSGTDDEWYEAIDTTTPEPASLLLLATGALAGGLVAFRRRRFA